LCGHEHPFGEHNRIQLPAAGAATSLVSLEIEPVALDRAP
jgi:hypothetical protein